MTKLNRIYDTWSTHYECNGIDENSDTVVDGSTDGLDNNADGVVDDDGERDTRPPTRFRSAGSRSASAAMSRRAARCGR